jgi:CRP/FNR family cyclic AMP-dependent transcriptional regulator
MERPSPSPGPFNTAAYLRALDPGKTVAAYGRGDVVYAQGDCGDAVFYIEEGTVSLRVTSRQGKERVIGLLGGEAFFGEGCLNGQSLRTSTATALTRCTIVRVEKQRMTGILRDRPDFAGAFLAQILSRNARIEEDLVDHLFNSSEKRLARVLLNLASSGQEGAPGLAVPKMSQETLASIVGTTRSRVSFFMNRFRKLGFIEYKNGLRIHHSFQQVLLAD